MQISTRNEDFIIDALELRTDLHILNEVFTDPKIVKVSFKLDGWSNNLIFPLFILGFSWF